MVIIHGSLSRYEYLAPISALNHITAGASQLHSTFPKRITRLC